MGERDRKHQSGQKRYEPSFHCRDCTVNITRASIDRLNRVRLDDPLIGGAQPEALNPFALPSIPG